MLIQYTRIFAFKKIYFTLEEAAVAIGIPKATLSMFLSTTDVDERFRVRTDYQGEARLTDKQVSELTTIFQAVRQVEEASKRKQLNLFLEGPFTQGESS